MAKKGVSDRYLQALWRKCVLLMAGNRCIICDRRKKDHELQCHHVVKRRHRVLRHDPKNGVVVCTLVCHEYADSMRGIAEISAKLGADRVEYLAERQQVFIKDYRFALGHSASQHEEWELANLKKELAKYQED